MPYTSVDVESTETDQREYPTGTAYDLDPGLTNNVVDQVETPNQLLARILLDDEQVVDTFDVKFPGEFIPVWKIVLYLFSTCGLFGIILLFRSIRRWCYKNRCCTPSLVSFEFGKMAVTSKGRVICWKEFVSQVKPPQKKYKGNIFMCYLDWCLMQILWLFAKICILMCCPDLCAPPVNFEYENFTRSYRVTDVKQITQYMTSEAHCIWCCLDYQAGVEISFNQFNHGSNHLQVASRSWFSDDHFGEEGQVAASSATRGAYYEWARGLYGAATNLMGKIERASGIAPNLNTLFVYADTGDRVHNGDVESILKDVNNLHKRLINLLPIPADAICPEKIDHEKFAKCGFPMVRPAVPSVYKYTDKFKNVTLVADDFSIQIPDSWMPLLDNEVVIATSGQVPKMTCIKWFLSIISCGVYYIMKVRRQKYTRSALVLTNKRLISIDIYERSGTVPLTLSNFSIQVRSYILENVYSGFINSTSKTHLEAGIECDGGAIFINFGGNGRSALPFAHALQMSVKRRESMIQGSVSHMSANLADNRTVKDIKPELIPYLSGETLVNIIQGSTDVNFEACGSGIWANLCNYLRKQCGCGMCWTKQVDQMWSKEACNEECCCQGQGFTPFFFPCLPYTLSCGLRPFQFESTVLITNMSIIRVATVGNYGLCGCLRLLGLIQHGPCMRKDSIIISWESIQSFSGFNLLIRGSGKENVTRRLCRGNCCGRIFCPIGVASADLKLDFKGNYSFSTIKEEPNKIWVKDEELNQSVKLLSKLQVILQEELVAKTKTAANPVAAVAKVAGSAPMAPVVPVKSIERDLEAGQN